MARLARLVVPGFPHHVTQRGNRRLPTFFDDDDYALYKYLLSEAAGKAGSDIWCYCLMPNHVHIIIVPSHDDGLRATFAEAHRNYGDSLPNALILCHSRSPASCNPAGHWRSQTFFCDQDYVLPRHKGRRSGIQSAPTSRLRGFAWSLALAVTTAAASALVRSRGGEGVSACTRI